LGFKSGAINDASRGKIKKYSKNMFILYRLLF
jgi:hypothetical protein